MPIPSRRLNFFPDSAISMMARLGEQRQAISLAQGVPDFDPPAELLEAAKTAISAGYNQYSATWGAPRLRQAIARKHSHFSGLEIDPNEHVTVTIGGTEALLAALTATTNPGDKVVIFSPRYEAYVVDSHLLDCEPVYIPLHPPKLTFDPAELRRAFQDGGRVLILCNPSNPTGKVFSRAELQIIADLAQEYDVTILADEIYEHIIYAPHEHTYIASLPGMFERTISCSSVSKSYAVTGWRVGWAIAPASISRGLRKVHDFLSVCAPTPLQEAAANALSFPWSYYEQMQTEYTRRKEVFLGCLERAGLRYIEPQGAYYVLVDISQFEFSDDYEFCRWMVEAIGVAATPGSYFFHEPVKNYVRMNFAKKEETLGEAGERLALLHKKI